MGSPDDRIDPVIQLYAPDATLITNVTSGGGQVPAELANLRLGQSGTYQVVCRAGDPTQAGAFTLALLAHASPNGNDKTIVAGQTLSGTVSAGQLASYLFTGAAGEQVTISMGSPNASIGPVIQLYAPDGTLITEVSGFPAELANLRLGQSGTYQVVCRAANPVQAGAFTLALLAHASPNSNDHPIVAGQTLSGTVSAGQLASYLFTGAAGEQVTISMGSPDDRIDPVIQLYAPDATLITNVTSGGGQVPAELANLRLGQSGTYQVVCRAGDPTQAGAFTLALLAHASPNSNDKTIVAGQTLSGTVSAGQLASYLFTGAAGEQVTISMGSPNASIGPVIQLYAPDGILITEVSGFPAELANLRLGQSGTYQVVCRAANPVQAGAFTLSYIVILRAEPVITWNSPADITYGTALGSAQLDATANTPGTFAVHTACQHGTRGWFKPSTQCGLYPYRFHELFVSDGNVHDHSSTGSACRHSQ